MVIEYRNLELALSKLRENSVDSVFCDVFAHNWQVLYNCISRSGNQYIYEKDVEALTEIVKYNELKNTSDSIESTSGKSLNNQTIIIKLNGGLGTTMGLNRAKSLLKIKGNLTFLDVIIHQVIALRNFTKAKIPLLFMNSYNTTSDTNEFLKKFYSKFNNYGLPLEFQQHSQPKLLADTLGPATFSENQQLEWCPPGHGDFWASFYSSGVLEKYISAGYRYAFISNADNLGATYNDLIGQHFQSTKAVIMLELADKTSDDIKGGHIVVRNGKKILREVAQIHPDDLEQALDMKKHPYFNTNSIWVDLQQLYQILKSTNSVLDLPVIINRKYLQPCDANTPEVIQLETAIGAAISVFEHTAVMQVPRSRFLPIKTQLDFDTISSNQYVLDDKYNMIKVNESF